MSSSAFEEVKHAGRPILLSLYDFLLEAGSPLIWAYLRRRRRAGREDAVRYPERRGIASHARPPGFLVWFHAASVGESTSMLRLAERLLADRPGTQILVTTGTVTSAALVQRRLEGRAIHQYVPVDRRAWVARFLDHWRPDCAIWIESEIWPNLLQGVARRGIPAALINARMSARSHARWTMAPAAIAWLLATFDLCLAQSVGEAERLRQLGARNVGYVGHLKYAADKLPAAPAELAALRRAIGRRPLWILASSHAGEETIAIAAHRIAAEEFPDLLTVIAPRHVDRAAAIAAEGRAAGLTSAVRSAGLPPSPEDSLYIVDAMGELGLWYRLAPIACIGGSLTPIGGHNPIEAAQLDCALLHGPYLFSMPEIASELAEAGASVVVRDAEALAAALRRLIREPATAQAMAAAARAVADRNADVIDRAFAVLEPLIDRAATGRTSP
jgi:3-deoxy-D-manno-octulosonic-acid transferase